MCITEAQCKHRAGTGFGEEYKRCANRKVFAMPTTWLGLVATSSVSLDICAIEHEWARARREWKFYQLPLVGEFGEIR